MATRRNQPPRLSSAALMVPLKTAGRDPKSRDAIQDPHRPKELLFHAITCRKTRQLSHVPWGAKRSTYPRGSLGPLQLSLKPGLESRPITADGAAEADGRNRSLADELSAAGEGEAQDLRALAGGDPPAGGRGVYCASPGPLPKSMAGSTPRTRAISRFVLGDTRP